MLSKDCDDFQLQIKKMKELLGSRNPCEVVRLPVRLLSCYTATPGARLFSLGMLALLLTLPYRCSVTGITFAFNGFGSDSDLNIVPNSAWVYQSANCSCYYLNPVNSEGFSLTPEAGRILYPGAVQMMDPVTNSVKNFSTTFIYQAYGDYTSGDTTSGEGLAFMMVPDNITLGADLGYMGLITTNNSQAGENYESDSHTFAVEFDFFQQPQFNDSNNNHIGLDFASMNSTISFVPDFLLSQTDINVLLQVWIEYSAVDFQIDVYVAEYTQGKPSTPTLSANLSATPVNLSLLNEFMYIGFASASGQECITYNTIFAWSFSTDGPAPPVYVAGEAPPSPPPPPSAPTPPTKVPPPSSNPGPPPPKTSNLPPAGVPGPPSPASKPSGLQWWKTLLIVVFSLLGLGGSGALINKFIIQNNHCCNRYDIR